MACVADGTPHSVSGTLIGRRQVAKITEIDGYEVEVRPEAHLALLTYEDRPGIVGTIGAILGNAGVNIANAQVGRMFAGGEALMALSLDSAVPADVLARSPGRSGRTPPAPCRWPPRSAGSARPSGHGASGYHDLHEASTTGPSGTPVGVAGVGAL